MREERESWGMESKGSIVREIERKGPERALQASINGSQPSCSAEKIL